MSKKSKNKTRRPCDSDASYLKANRTMSAEMRACGSGHAVPDLSPCSLTGKGQRADPLSTLRVLEAGCRPWVHPSVMWPDYQTVKVRLLCQRAARRWIHLKFRVGTQFRTHRRQTLSPFR